MTNENQSRDFAVIRWSVEDLCEALTKAGVEPDTANVNRFLQHPRAARTLHELSVQFGWETLSDIITNLQSDGILPKS
jgi:hypothetical protein